MKPKEAKTPRSSIALRDEFEKWTADIVAVIGSLSLVVKDIEEKLDEGDSWKRGE